MHALLNISGVIDRINAFVGKWVSWLILAAVVVSATNAIIRKLFNMSSNGFLEIQWYFFSAVFLLCAGYTMLRNEHVKIDVFAHMLSKKKQIWIDIIGIVFFLWPMSIIIMSLAWPLFVDSFTRNEVSTNAGGLIIWPARLMIPVGFALLLMQSVSELVKRLAFLSGRGPNPLEKHQGRSAEEELAEEIARERGVEAAPVLEGKQS